MQFVESLSAVTRDLFVIAGWSPGRHVPTVQSGNSKASVLAAKILSRVGGLHVGAAGKGIDCVTADIFFSNRFADERQRAVTSVFPGLGEISSLGDAHNGHAMLFVNDAGNLLVFTDPDSRLYLAGADVAEGIDRLLLGYRWDIPWVPT
jgi:SUKH-3 immunity protein